MHIEDNVRSGMNPEEAHRIALIKLGASPHRLEAESAQPYSDRPACLRQWRQLYCIQLLQQPFLKLKLSEVRNADAKAKRSLFRSFSSVFN
jgi:hypothetical protein